MALPSLYFAYAQHSPAQYAAYNLHSHFHSCWAMPWAAIPSMCVGLVPAWPCPPCAHPLPKGHVMASHALVQHVVISIPSSWSYSAVRPDNLTACLRLLLCGCWCYAAADVLSAEAQMQVSCLQKTQSLPAQEPSLQLPECIAKLSGSTVDHDQPQTPADDDRCLSYIVDLC